ncbi:hypothetical protein HPB51_011339 [Rhipicephalus microplus]|uniref:Peptidase M13 N-terminal domain-containing protein n=1 Tax=Rhipicephalus microplus TaxID=6941 RepID=A0A9J6F192_RHIMP|nr:hypothetical protein HPB51_011339 [Rhipicephalus microplus]
MQLEAPELLLGPTSWQLTLGTETVQDAHKHRWAYERYALAILCDVLPGVASGGALSKLATDLYVFEQALSAHIPRRSTYADRVEVRLHHLQESHDLANIHFAQALWSGILRDVFDNLEHSTLQLVPIVLFSRYYLAFLNDLLWKRSMVLVNYLGWRMVEYIAWSCSANLRDHRRRFRDAVRPFKLAADSLEVQCAMEVHQLLPASSSRLYRFAVSLLPKNERILLHLTASSLKVALTAILQGSPWVDNATQSHAIRKVQRLNVSFGDGTHPATERFASGQSLWETDLYENLLTIARRKAQVLRATMHGDEPVASRSVHFSNSGFVLAKEMLQAFLGSGQYFHEDGFKNYSWWSLFTATNYEVNKRCMEFLLKENSFTPTSLPTPWRETLLTASGEGVDHSLRTRNGSGTNCTPIMKSVSTIVSYDQAFRYRTLDSNNRKHYPSVSNKLEHIPHRQFMRDS